MSHPSAAVRLTEVDYDPFASPELARAVPTTDAQREIWLADQLGSEASLAFNEAITLQLRGAIDVQAVQDALLALADRHESLRSTFSADGASMLIAPRGSLQARLLDLRGGDETQRERELAALRRAEVTTPFDLTQGPLVRAVLVTCSAGEHVLLFCAHHIVCDGWSFGVIARELTALYAAFAEGRQAALAPADSFGDYVLAALEPEHAQAAEADERYWVSVFDRSVPVLDLPADRPRRAQREFAARREDCRLAPEVVEAARALGAKSGASLFATLFSLFAALMARLGGDADVVVGVPAAGQAAMGMDRLVGHCVNLLPVRMLADGKLPVQELLRHGRERVLDAYDHQRCTFGRLLGRLQLARDPARLPLVSVQFNLDSTIDADELSSPNLAVRLASVPREYENFELFVNATQLDGAIVLECQYNAALFDAATVRRWLGLFEAAIRRAAADAQQPVAALFAAGDEDRADLERWNRTAEEYPRSARVEHLVTAQAKAAGDAWAVVDGEGTLTYEQLERRANALALALAAQGVGPGGRVGLACGRNRHLLVALLGILKTGAAYVPLDPAFPPDRLAHMRADAQLQWVVSDASVRLDAGEGEQRVLWADSVSPTERTPVVRADTDAAAYVIYTSGSTGRPKGVIVPQRAVVNFLASMRRTPGLAAADRLLAVTTPSFDIAVLELLLPLTVGARVVLADRDTVMDGAKLRALLEAEAATVMQATPSGWRLLIDAGWRGGPGFKALVGGEPLPADLAQALLARTGELWNMYGPTETTVWSTCWRVREGGPVAIGTPIANTTVDVLDEALRPCPVGVPGEIFIGGDGVTSGYLDRPELTAERFLADPARPGQRLYRTGDRGRWRNDGLLEHLGRLDTQVKVRGYRIELGEIEANVLAFPGVQRAVVVTREDTPGDVRVVAYFVASGARPDAGAMREHLRRKLPEYMMPAHLECVPAIPLLPNGKVNAKALPRPEAPAGGHSAREVPRTPLQARVLALMEGTLHLPGLGIGDDFFAAGGHSLLAARLTASVNAAFSVSLPLRAVFEAPTAERLAAAIERAQAEQAPARAVIEHAADGTEAPLTVMQERIRFMERLHPGRVVYNTPSAHRLAGPLDPLAFEAAMRRIVQRQASLRTVIDDRGETPRQRVLPGMAWELPLVDLSGLPAAEREHELMRRLQTVIDEPIAIDRAPLFRAALYRLGPEEHVFLFMPHHIVWDGWSFDLLYQEMAEILPATLEGREPRLPPLEVDYLDFARWHERWRQGDECRAQLAWWKRRYAAVQPPRALPTDRARRPGMTGTGAVEWVHVDKALTERLRALARQNGATVNMLVLAVYCGMLSEAVASPSLLLGVPVRGRISQQLEPVMGFFNNLLPMPVNVRLDASLPAWLAEVKGELVQAFANADVPFEQLANEPEFVALNQAAGLYQSLFSFQDARERPRRWGPLSHSSVLVMQKGATEDFGLWLMEVPGGLEGGINYNADLFDAATARIFRERLLGLLRRAVDEPQGTLQALLHAPGSDRDAFAAWVGRSRRSEAAVPSSRLPAPAAALDEAQRALAAIWSDLLGVPIEQMRAEDNFFDLGGSSLLVMRACAAAEASLGLRIEPRRFVAESLAQLARPAPQPAAAAPARNGTERRMADIWAALLGVEADQIRSGDNFFDLGGSSLLVMRAAGEAQAQLGLRIEPRRFVSESLGQLATAAAEPALAAAEAEPAAASASAPKSGLLSRVFGRKARGA
ncbi:MAG: amino acid adenylation domain-containing protein [Rubrivivax sp.]|nr:amino acid adenylation domain-containing protein [Rubrivivax sp.]